MTLASGPFNTQSWDANDLSGYFASLVGNGVFPNPSNNLQVVTHENMQTKIKSGIGWINGKIIRNPTDLILTHDIADGVLKRIDRVVMRVNYVTNNAEFAIKKGAFASNPTAPALTRNSDMYELALADVYITNGATTITNANITDLRSNTELCGIVKGLIDQIDTTDLFNQYNDAFQTWFTHLQNELNENQAANLQNQIDGVTSQLAEFKTLLSENAIMHNNIYRGKYLGSSVTPEQYQAIQNGTFEDLYIGDYWTINGVNYRIAGFDYYYNTGDTACTTHHAVIVPDSYLYMHPMNDANTTDGGYVNSKMYTEGLAQALSTIKSAFSGHVLKHRRLLSNATSDGKASGWAWFDSEVELMTEPMVYGTSVFGTSSMGGGSGYNVGVDKSQLPLFALNPRMINTRQTYWLRDVVSDTYFALAYYLGYTNRHGASSAYGVRPAFSIS